MSSITYTLYQLCKIQPDVQKEIISNLDEEARYKISATCKTFYTFINDHFSKDLLTKKCIKVLDGERASAQLFAHYRNYCSVLSILFGKYHTVIDNVNEIDNFFKRNSSYLNDYAAKKFRAAWRKEHTEKDRISRNSNLSLFQMLIEGGAQLKSPVIVDYNVAILPLVLINEDYLAQLIELETEVRTIHLMAITQHNQLVQWNHIEAAIRKGYEEETILLLLNNLRKNIELSPLAHKHYQRCSIQALNAILKVNVKEETQLTLINKLEKISGDDLLQIIQQKELPCSEKVLGAILEKFTDAGYPKADCLIKNVYRLVFELERISFSHMKKLIELFSSFQKEKIKQNYLKNPIFMQFPEEVILTLIEIHPGTIAVSDLRAAMICNHSEKVILTLIEQCSQQEMIDDKQLDRSLYTPRTCTLNIVNKLIEKGCVINSTTLQLALNEISDEDIIIKVIDSFSPSEGFEAFSHIKQALLRKLSDAVILKLINKASELNKQIFEEIKKAQRSEVVIKAALKKCAKAECNII